MIKAFFATILIANFSLAVFAQAETFETESALVEHFRSELSNANILLLGEYHEDFAEKAHYPALLKIIHQRIPDYNCLAVELGPESDFILKSYYQKKFTLEDAGNSFAYLSDGQYADYEEGQYYLHVLSSWLSSANLFYDWGNSVYEVDMNIAEKQKFKPSNAEPNDLRKGIPTDYNDDELSEQRNHVMSQKILSLLQNQSCKKIISINGNWHLYLNAANGSLPKYLSPQSVLSLDLTSTQRFAAADDHVFSARIATAAKTKKATVRRR